MKRTEFSNLLFDQSKDLIWVINADLKLVYANKTFLSFMKAVTGVDQKLNEAILVEGFGEGYNEKWNSYYNRAFKGEFFEIEEQYVNPESNEIQFSQITFEPLTEDNDKIFAVACQSRDITRLIKLSETNRMLDSSLDVFCTINEQGHFVYVNAASAKLWGYSPEELNGKPYVGFILEEDVNKSNEIAANVLKGQEIKSFINRYKKKDGGIAYNLWSARWDNDTKLIYCVARDGKDKIEQEEKILQSELRFKSLVQEGSDLIGILNVEGYYSYVSPTSISVLGIAPEEFIGKSAFDFIHPDDAENVLTGLQKIITENWVKLEPFRFQNSKKEWRWIETVLTNMLENPAVNGIVANSRDITEERKLKELNRQTRSLAKIGSWEVDLVNRSFYWSDEVHRLHTTDSKLFEPTFETAFNFYREDFRQLVYSQFENCISKGEPIDFEAVLVTSKKKEVWVRAIGNPEILNGVCTRIYGSFQDIHDRKVAEIRLQSLADNLPGVVYQYRIYPDGSDSLKHISKGSQQVWGFSADEVLQNNQLVWDRIRAGGEFEKVKKSIADSVDSKTKWTYRWKYVMPSGEIRTHTGFGSPNFLADGTILFHSVILDVTQEAANEELLEQVTELAKIGSWEINLAQNKTYWSAMVHNILETDPDQYVPDRVTNINFFREDFRSTVIEKLNDASEKGTPLDFEVVMVTRNNNEKWVRVLGNVEMVGGKPNRIYGSFQDINDRKQAVMQLLQANERFEKVTEATNDAIWDWDLVNQTYYRSKAIERFFGKETSKSFTQKGFWKDNFHPEDFTKIQKSINKAIVNPSCPRWELEYRVLNGQNKTIYVINRGVIIRNNNGKAIRMVGAMTDITEQKKLDEENRFKANLLSRIGQAAIATNLDGVVNYWNKAAETIYGWTLEEAIGKNIMYLTTPDANKEQAMQIMEGLKKGQTWSGEFAVQKKNGTKFPARISNSPIYDENNVLSGIFGISSDITQEVKNEELLKQYTLELERSNEELEQFAFVASHDLQEPLRMISTFMEQLQQKYGDLIDEKGNRYIHFATDGAKRMKQIILDLLEYSRASKPAEGIEEVDMNHVLSEFKQLRRKLISEKTASINSKNLPKLNTYKAAITQIFHCLIDNSLKYSKEGTAPIVELDVVEKEKEYEFSIKDNGIGIDPQFYDKIFIIFQRLHNKDQYAGTGIGLAIAKRHVQFLGGRIWLESKPGEGTTFYFTIPKIKQDK